jgi:hypothetical protein
VEIASSVNFTAGGTCSEIHSALNVLGSLSGFCTVKAVFEKYCLIKLDLLTKFGANWSSRY